MFSRIDANDLDTNLDLILEGIRMIRHRQDRAKQQMAEILQTVERIEYRAVADRESAKKASAFYERAIKAENAVLVARAKLAEMEHRVTEAEREFRGLKSQCLRQADALEEENRQLKWKVSDTCLNGNELAWYIQKKADCRIKARKAEYWAGEAKFKADTKVRQVRQTSLEMAHEKEKSAALEIALADKGFELALVQKDFELALARKEIEIAQAGARHLSPLTQPQAPTLARSAPPSPRVRTLLQ
ncbi:MAG: hypothetical protein M1815_000556 [Lichina confinis]|nr:MAG: hypothetical protein M1815_000556 [Lichina confinis]